MFDLIYVESAVRDHPRARRLLDRSPRASVVPIDRYGEVFNRRAQNFRLQKRRPSLILAEKHGAFVLDTPPGYGIGATRNVYFSHMLNCVYDCRYCFLQGMYRSAHLVVFVNFEDFERSIRDTAASAIDSNEGEICFFSGYDCDSLALEPVTGFASAFLDVFAALPASAWLELRTKSVQTRALLDRDAVPNCVVAFSLLPPAIGERHEPGVPSLARRLVAIAELARRGWPIGLRFDPLVHVPDFESVYRAFFAEVFGAVEAEQVHSVSFGAFRLPRDFHRRMVELYPEEALLARGLEERDGMVSYAAARDAELREFCETEILRFVPSDRLFPCA